jgi:hypothetical protein
MSNNRMPAAIAAESRSAPAPSVVMTHDDYLAKLQTDPYFRPVKPSWAPSEPTPISIRAVARPSHPDVAPRTGDRRSASLRRQELRSFGWRRLARGVSIMLPQRKQAQTSPPGRPGFGGHWAGPF